MFEFIHNALFVIIAIGVFIETLEALKGTFKESWDEAFHDDNS